MNIVGTTYFALIGILVVISVLFIGFVIYKAITSPGPDDRKE